MGPILGTAQELLQLVADGAERRTSYSACKRQIDSSVVPRTLAKCALDLDAAWLQMHCAAVDIDATGEGDEIEALVNARLRGVCGRAVSVLQADANELLDIAGASAFALSSLIQSPWRDLSAASRHALLGSQPTYELLGRAAYDLKPRVRRAVISTADEETRR